MTYPNRTTALAHLAEQIETKITDLQTIYDYDPQDIEGESPLCIISRGGLRYSTHTDVEYTVFRFVVGFWVRSDDDRQAAEEKLDDLAVDLAEVLELYYSADFYQESELLEAEKVDGLVYSVELHYVEIRWRTNFNAEE